MVRTRSFWTTDWTMAELMATPRTWPTVRNRYVTGKRKPISIGQDKENHSNILLVATALLLDDVISVDHSPCW